MLNDEALSTYALRIIGTFIGVLASVIMVAPEHTRAALGRVVVGVSMGFIFAPTVPLWGALGFHPFGFLAGSENEMILARSAASGFTIWFILELLARLLSSTDWLEKLARSIIEAKTRRRDDE